jgi:hypothetical protein
MGKETIKTKGCKLLLDEFQSTISTMMRGIWVEGMPSFYALEITLHYKKTLSFELL